MGKFHPRKFPLVFFNPEFFSSIYRCPNVPSRRVRRCRLPPAPIFWPRRRTGLCHWPRVISQGHPRGRLRVPCRVQAKAPARHHRRLAVRTPSTSSITDWSTSWSARWRRQRTALKINEIYRETVKGFWAGHPYPVRNQSRSDALRHPLPHPSRVVTWQHARVRIHLQLGRKERT